MALRILYRETRAEPRRVALFPGAWNPPTIAHVEIARAALAWADEVVWVLPRALPHKPLDETAFQDRCGLIEAVARETPGFSAAVSGGGLYAEIAEEARQSFGEGPELGLVCGRDAAERIAAWDYGRPGVFEELLRGNRLLVAARAGEYRVPAGQRDRIVLLALNGAFDQVSSTEIRRRIASGMPWTQLVPPAIVETVRDLYTDCMT